MKKTNPKPFVFVLMPFLDEFKDIYEFGIKSACDESGAYCERVDEQFFDESILQRIYNQINKADIVISDMTSRNPNVFYETGYAHALDKRVILLTQKSEDIPFDLKHYPHIIYGGKITDLKASLGARIRWCIQNPKKSLSEVDLPLRLFINSEPIESFPKIKWPLNIKHTFYLDIHNVGRDVVRPENYKIGLVLPNNLAPKDETKNPYIIHKDGTGLVNFEPPEPIFPEGWSTIYISLRTVGNKPGIESESKIAIRLFTKIGPKDFEFSFVP